MAEGDASKLVQELIQTEKRWTKAHRELDLDVIDSILSAKYRQIGADGSIIGRSQLLESYRRGDRYWEIAESSDHNVQIVGKVGVLIGRWRGKGVHSGGEFDYSARFLALYVREEGEWKLQLDISVPLPE